MIKQALKELRAIDATMYNATHEVTFDNIRDLDIFVNTLQRMARTYQPKADELFKEGKKHLE